MIMPEKIVSIFALSNMSESVAAKVALFAPARIEAAANGIRAHDESVLASFAADVASISEDAGIVHRASSCQCHWQWSE